MNNISPDRGLKNECVDGLACPTGYTMVNGKCEIGIQVDADLDITTFLAADGNKSTAYGWRGTRFYEDADTFTLPLRGDSSAILVDNDGAGSALVPQVLDNGTEPWDKVDNLSLSEGRLHRTGVWSDAPPVGGDQLPIDEWVGFRRCVDVPETKKYCLGFAADNRMRLTIIDPTNTSTLIARFDAGGYEKHFGFWHIIEVTLQAGANIIELEGWNDELVAAFGAEIYDASVAELMAITTLEELEILLMGLYYGLPQITCFIYGERLLIQEIVLDILVLQEQILMNVLESVKMVMILQILL